MPWNKGMGERIEPNRCMVGLPFFGRQEGDYRYCGGSRGGAVPQTGLHASGEM